MNICIHCKSKLNVPFDYIGLNFSCPVCGKLLIIDAEPKTRTRKTGYEITFHSFKTLIKHSAQYNEIISFIERKCNCKSVLLENERLVFQNSENEFIPLEILYTKIQNDRKLQRNIYQLAMNIWR